MAESLIEMAKEMVAIRSVSRQSNAEIIDYIATRLKASQFTLELQPYVDAMAERKINLMAKKGEGNGGLAFITHSDTVPGQEEYWDAFDPVVKDGRLHGRGSCDMRGPIAAAMVATMGVDASQLSAPVYVIVTADEEIGSIGAEHLVAHSKMLRQSAPAYGIVTEPTKMIPVYAHKGWATMKITAMGKAAHTSTGLGVSADFLIAPFMAEMARLNEQFQSDESFMNMEFQPPTNGFNMTINDGDAQLNVTAARTVCQLSLRVMPEARSEEIVQIITKKAKGYGFEVSSEIREGVYTSPDSPLVREACRATGAAQAHTAPYNTDGVFFQEMMDLIILGPGDIAVAHTVDESVAVAELEKAATVYSRLIEQLCM